MRIATLCVSAGIICAAIASTAARACSACGCTLNSDWASQGLAATRGWRFDLRYDFFEQDQLRSGTDSIARPDLVVPSPEEVQQFTINRNYTFALDHSPSRDWGFSVALPWFDRSHATIAAGDGAISTSHDRGIGDLRMLARFQGFDSQRSSGIEFGLKLPTGEFNSTFARGPQQGATLDRGVQLGTGTTDVLLGAYKFGAFTPAWGYFAQALVQQPVNSREDFRAGAGLNLSLGLRYMANTALVPQLQVNARVEKREQGANADVANSGATLVYLSPGLTWNVSRRFAAFAFVQVPLYQRVNGLQIEPTQLASVGLHYRF